MMANLVWHIDGAVVQFSDDQEKENWISAGKPMSFEFDPENSDDHGESIMDIVSPQCFDLDNHNSKLLIDTSNNEVNITAWVMLNVELRDSVTRDDFNEWANDNGGWACATIMLNNADAYISEDSGGEFRWD